MDMKSTYVGHQVAENLQRLARFDLSLLVKLTVDLYGHH